MFQSTEIVRKIFYANILAFFSTIILEVFLKIPVMDYLALFPFSDPHYHTYQFITSMFMHGSIPHLLFNMLALLSFGPDVENQLGSRKFALYYLIMGLLAALLQLLLTDGAMIGASGAIFGILVYFTMLNPDAKLSLFLLPIGFKAKYFTLVMVVIELVLALIGGGHIGHWAHLGGAFGGFVLYLLERKFSIDI
jgi:membrane associated rhomboid family serine protease